MNLHPRSGLAAGVIGLGLLAPAAAQARVPVNLRIEGPTKTVFEGRVTVPKRTFSFTGEKARHTCDGTAALGGPSPKPVPTRGGAIAEASERFGFALKGTWNDALGATFTKVGGQRVAFDPDTQRFLAEYADDKFAQLGACADPVHRGEDVLFAYGTGSETLLALGGPKIAVPGRGFSVRVRKAGTHANVEGATVGGVATRANGFAFVGPFKRGYHVFQATKAGAIRSNHLRVCVSDSGDGACPPIVHITDIRSHERFRRAHAPRTLRGVVEAAPFGLKSVRLRLTRRGHGHQTYKVHRAWDWSRRLPARLGRGHYTLEAVARDRRGRRGRDEVVFSVR